MIDIERQVMAHAERLSVDIGPRPVASPGDRAAAGYIEGVFRDAELAVQRQAFSCPSWDHQETVLELAGRQLEATANWRSLPCDVTGAILPVGALDALAQADLEGEIALLHGELSQDEISNRASTVYYPDRHRKLNDLLDRKRPVAVIAVCPLLQSIRHVIKDPDMDIPSVTVSPHVGRELLRSAGAPVWLHIAAARSEGESCNLIGTRSGTRPERIVLCAHYDTVWGTPGAFDNASGVAVMLTLAQLLSGKSLSTGLEFVAFSAEEFGGQGADAYMAPYAGQYFPSRWDQPPGKWTEAWRPILAAINADGVGLELGANSITVIAASQALEGMVDQIRTHYPSVARVSPWPASDHYTFYSHGVPSIPLGCSGGVANIHHQPIDTIDWLSPAKLAEAVSLIADLVDALQDKTSSWCRPTVAT